MSDPVFMAEDAKQLLDNKLFKGAFNAVAEYLDKATLGCDPDNKEKAQRIIISRQLLEAVKREVVRYIEDGEMARIEMDELKTKREKSILRFVR